MGFEDILRSMQRHGDEWVGTAGADWLQGRSLFGGLQAAVAVQAMRALVAAPGTPLRTLQVTFLAPVPSGALRVRTQLLRSGRNASHVEARLVDGGGRTQCLVVGIFGVGRLSRVRIVPERPPVEALHPVTPPDIEGLTPAFTRHFSTRWLRGSLPYSGGDSTNAIIEVGMHGDGPLGEPHLCAIADAIPPLALALLDRPVPGSSMTWTLELLADRWEHQSRQGWRLDAHLVAARDGYSSQDVMIWAPDATPAALSRQNMVVFG